MEEKALRLFHQLKPLTLPLVDFTHLDSKCAELSKLGRFMQDYEDPRILAELVDYIVFPLLSLIRHPLTREAINQSVLSALSILLGRVPARNNQLFQELLVTLTLVIQGKFQGTSAEEIRGAAAGALLCLVTATPEFPDSRILTEEIHLGLSHVISNLLDGVLAGQGLQYRLQLLETLEGLVRLLHGDAALAVLPGVSTVLCKAVLRDAKENHKLIVACVEILADLLERTMADELNKPLLPKVISDLSQLVDLSKETLTEADLFRTELETEFGLIDERGREPEKGPGKARSGGALPLVKRNQAWLKQTNERLSSLLKQLSSLVDHPAWKVRLSLARLAFGVASKCARSLRSAVSMLVEKLVFYCSDEIDSVRDFAIDSLKTLAARFDDDFSLVSLLQENLRAQLTSLPRKVTGNNEQVKNEALVQIIGYLMLLGEKASTLIDTTLETLSLGLLKILTFDKASVRLVEDRLVATTRIDTEQSRLAQDPPEHLAGAHFPKKTFTYFRDDKIFDRVTQLCRLLGYWGNTPFLLDHFIQVFLGTVEGEDGRQTAEAIYLMNQLLLGAAALDVRPTFQKSDHPVQPRLRPHEVRSLARSLLRNLLESRAWYQPTNNIDAEAYNEFHQAMRIKGDQFQQHTVGKLNDNILQITLLLEGVATISKIYGQEFRNLLMESLYPLLESYEDSNRMVHEAASIALQQIAESCGYGTVSEMILENVDYIVNGASAKLRHFAENPSVPRVICAAIHQVGAPIVPFLEDSLEEVFDALDQYHSRQYFVCWSLIKVLQAFVSVVVRQLHNERAAAAAAASAAPLATKGAGQEALPVSREILDFCREYRIFVGETKGGEPEEKKEGPTKIEDIQQYFEEYHAEKARKEQALENEPPMEKDPAEEQQAVEEDEGGSGEEKPPTDSRTKFKENLCYRIVDKVSHFFAADAPKLRSLALGLTSESLPALAVEKQKFLPLANDMWPMVVGRLSDQETPVVLAAMSLIANLLHESKDFLQKRITADVWPVLRKHLSKTLAEPSQTVRGPLYKYSHSFKIQQASFQLLSSICQHLELPDVELDRMVEDTFPFLSGKLSPDTQVEALAFFKVLARKCPDIVWGAVIRGSAAPLPLPPGVELAAVTVPDAIKIKDLSYSENISRVLSWMEGANQ